jgi:hypothetical protein
MRTPLTGLIESNVPLEMCEILDDACGVKCCGFSSNMLDLKPSEDNPTSPFEPLVFKHFLETTLNVKRSERSDEAGWLRTVEAEHEL